MTVIFYGYSTPSPRASYTDSLENALGQQLENGRLLSLMLKLGMVSDRPSGAVTVWTLHTGVWVMVRGEGKGDGHGESEGYVGDVRRGCLL